MIPKYTDAQGDAMLEALKQLVFGANSMVSSLRGGNCPERVLMKSVEYNIMIACTAITQATPRRGKQDD